MNINNGASAAAFGPPLGRRRDAACAALRLLIDQQLRRHMQSTMNTNNGASATAFGPPLGRRRDAARAAFDQQLRQFETAVKAIVDQQLERLKTDADQLGTTVETST